MIAYRDCKTKYEQRVHGPEQQLRRQQGLDICNWYRRDLEKVAPNGTIAKKRVMSVELIKEAVTKAAEAKQAAAARAALMAPPQADTVVEKVEETKPPEEEPLDIVYAIDSAPTYLPAPPSEQAMPGKKPKKQAKKDKENKTGAGRGRGRGGSSPSVRLKTKTSVASSQASFSDAASQAGTVVSHDGSSGSGRAPSKALTAEEKAEKTLKKWMVDLSVETLLKGECTSLALHHATNALGGIKAHHGEGHVVYVLLRGHIQLFTDAKKLLPSEIGSTSPSERASILRDLKIAGMQQVPVFTAASLVAQCAEEATDIETKVRILTPAPLDSASSSTVPPFDPVHPTLAAAAVMGLADSQQGKMMQRILVKQCLCPTIVSGEAGKAKVETFCHVIQAQLGGLVGKSKLLVSYAVEELLAVADFMSVLLSTTSKPDDSAKLSNVLDSSQDCKVIVKQAPPRAMGTHG